MIDGLKPYPAMKDSGVPWLGEVPEHWEVQTVGRLGQLFKGNGGSKADEVDAGVPCVRYGDLYTRHEFFITKTQACVTPDRASAYTPIRFGDLLFAASGETDEDIGRSAVNLLQADARCGGDVLVLRPSREFVPRFLGYAADSPASRIQKTTMGRGFTVVHIYGTQLKHLALTIPPLPEQAAIVRFLDHADRRIRRYIRAKQKLIKLLEEQKQAIIHRAVTRGLDPNVRLKPSGVEWLGEVPAHWARAPIRQLAARGRSTFVNGPFGSDLLTSELTVAGVPVIYIRDISSGSYRRVSKAYVTGPKAASLEFCQVSGGDVLVAKVGDPPGTAAIYPPDEPNGIVTQDVIRIRPDTSRVIAEYLVAYLNSRAGRVAVGPVVVESTRGRVSLPDFRAVPIVLPPLTEQQAILGEIGAITADIGAAAGKAQREIDLLREYRTRLIADVVTGKLDVREAAARLPEDDEEPQAFDEAEALRDAEDESAADDLDPEPQEAEA